VYLVGFIIRSLECNTFTHLHTHLLVLFP
jgi:hypothetical protein